MIALTGIVFSLAFVMVQFSVTAYSPWRVLCPSRQSFEGFACDALGAPLISAHGFPGLEQSER
jgi:hypothetical protein